MTPDKLIQNYIQEQLGTRYIVGLNGNRKAVNDEIQAALYLTHNPYPIDDGTETISLRIEVYAPCTTDGDMDDFASEMQAMFAAIHGVKNTIAYGGTTYKFRCYMSSWEPQTTYNDTGETMVHYVVNGMIVSTSSNAVSGMDISVKAKLSSDAALESLILVKYTCDYSVPHDLSVSLNTVEPHVFPNFINRVHNILFIADNSTVSRRIEKMAMGISADTLTELYSLQITASDASSATKTVKLITANIDAQIGGYMLINATFRGA